MNICPNCKCNLKKHEKEILNNILVDELQERIDIIEKQRIKAVEKMNKRVL